MVVFMDIYLYICLHAYMCVGVCVHTFVYVATKKVNKFERERIC